MPVATHEFQTAARAQAAALGRPDFDAVYVPHPIQDQTKEEIERRAEATVAEIYSRLTALNVSARNSPPGPRSGKQK